MMSLFDPLVGLFDLGTGVRADMRAWCDINGVPTLCRLVHYLTDVKTWLLCLVPVLLLQRWAPARPMNRSSWSSLAHDWCYPLLSIGIASHLVVPVVNGVYDLGRSIWSTEVGVMVQAWHPGLQFVLAFVVQDFLRYLSHFLRHKVRWLWHFHAIHHSQENLNPGTTYRTHPLEALPSALLMTLPIGLIGIDPVPWIYAGVTSLFWDLFIHSNVRTNLGLLGKFIVSPQHHRVHHSALPEHFDRNYGERLTLWDWLFGTLARDRSIYPPTGCGESRVLMERPQGWLQIPRSWMNHFLYPFGRMAADVRGRSRARD